MVLTRSERNRLVSAGMDPNTVANAQSIPRTSAEAEVITAPSAVPGATMAAMTTTAAVITPSVQQFLSLAGQNGATVNPQSSSTSIISPDYSSITARGDRQGEVPVQQQPHGSGNPNATSDSWKEQVARQMQQFQQSLQEIARAFGQQAPVGNVNPQVPAQVRTPLVNGGDYFNGGAVQPNSNEAYARHFRPVREPHYAQEFGRISSPVGDVVGNYQTGNKVDFSKWGVKFDGSTKSMGAEDFIFRLNSLRQDYGCTYGEVLRGFHQLLEGQALDWYWSLRKLTPLHTWFDLEKAFLNQYRRVRGTELVGGSDTRSRRPHYTKDDARLYTRINIGGHELGGLLDSGATVTCLGRNCIEFVEKTGLQSTSSILLSERWTVPHRRS